MPSTPVVDESPLAEIIDNVWRALLAAHDEVEPIVWLVENDVDKTEYDVSSIDQVTLERIGVLACVLADIDSHVAELAAFRRRLADGIDAFAAIRREQRALTVRQGGGDDA